MWVMTRRLRRAPAGFYSVAGSRCARNGIIQNGGTSAVHNKIQASDGGAAERDGIFLVSKF